MPTLCAGGSFLPSEEGLFSSFHHLPSSRFLPMFPMDNERHWMWSLDLTHCSTELHSVGQRVPFLWKVGRWNPNSQS